MTWHAFAACRTRQDIDWVPVQEHKGGAVRAAHLNLAAARAVCASCPVRGRCLDEAVRDRLNGIWGGTTDTERRRLRRVQSSAEHRRADLLARLEREAQ